MTRNIPTTNDNELLTVLKAASKLPTYLLEDRGIDPLYGYLSIFEVFDISEETFFGSIILEDSTQDLLCGDQRVNIEVIKGMAAEMPTF